MDFPTAPVIGQRHPFTPTPGVPVFIWDGEKWTADPLTGAVRYDAAQSLTAPQQAQARENIAVASASGSNVVINGDFRVNQGGYVSAAVLAAGAYGHDQWKAGASGGDYSFTQLKSSTQITIASGKSLIQPIEDANVVGGSYVLTWTGTAQARAGVNTLTPAGAYAASPLLIVGQTAGTVMSVEFNNGTLGTVKLESGSNATPFVMRPYGEELVTCQSYYQKYDGVLISGYMTSGGLVYIEFPFSQEMRAVPTVAFSNDAEGNSSGVVANSVSTDHVRLATAIVSTGMGTHITDMTLDARL